jgi:hypothetical protein
MSVLDSLRKGFNFLILRGEPIAPVAAGPEKKK